MTSVTESGRRLGGRFAAMLLAWGWVGGAVSEASGEDYLWTTFAGSPSNTNGADGTRLSASFNGPTGAAVDAAGSVYVADEMNHTIRKVTPNGVVTTLAGVAGVSGTNDGTGSAARFNVPMNLTLDGAGNLLVADTLNHAIRKVTAGGVVTTLAGLPGTEGFLDATGAEASFNQPSGVALDSRGNLYVADGVNEAVRKVTADGTVTTVSTALNFPEDLAVGPSNIIYVANAGDSTIRRVTPEGVVSLLAGSPGNPGSQDGTGSGAQFAYPEGLRVDSAGNVFVADYGNNLVRKVTPAGVVTTLGGQAGVAGTNDGPGTGALFNALEGITLDKSGNLYVADTANSTIRIGIAPGPVWIAMQGSGPNVRLSWTNSAFSLEAAPAVSGAYTNVDDAISPYMTARSGNQRFFRLRAN